MLNKLSLKPSFQVWFKVHYLTAFHNQIVLEIRQPFQQTIELMHKKVT